MTHQELVELLRMVASGRRDAADKLADLLHPLLKESQPVQDAPKVTKRKVAA